ncbi:hypothetical protein T01_2198 [Trichinella spiralis]|uniref:Uncharacterized protein n=1 Tax=Trichinella spiralis TaxID=6334 RepID=A0A0V1B5I5_TRISP|nr:hypothetical protein T01_2198 [Trichinella spiralis]
MNNANADVSNEQSIYPFAYLREVVSNCGNYMSFDFCISIPDEARAALASTAGDEGKLCFLAALKAVYRRLYVRVVVDQGFAAACFCRALFGLCNSLWRRPPVNKQNSCRWIIDIFQSPGDTNNMQKMSFFQRKSSLPFPVVCDSLLIYPYRLVQVPEH